MKYIHLEKFEYTDVLTRACSLIKKALNDRKQSVTIKISSLYSRCRCCSGSVLTVHLSSGEKHCLVIRTLVSR